MSANFLSIRRFLKTHTALLLLVIIAFLESLYAFYLPIYGDEAYYWVWSKKLALSYYDHPPFIAYVNYLFCRLFGDTIFAVRISSILLLSGAGYFVYLLTKEFSNEKTALIACVFFITMPISQLGYTIHTIDSELLFWWCAALYFAYGAFHGGQTRFFMLTGFAIGCGLLSKYTMVLFYGVLLVYILYSRRFSLLVSPKSWLAVIVSLLVFSPVIIYNVENHFASFIFQYTHGTAEGFSLRFDKFFEFFGGQFLIVGPVFGALLFFAFSDKTLYAKDDKRLLLTISFICVIGFFLYKALFKKMQLNWGIVAFVGALPIVAEYVYRSRYKKIIFAFLGLTIFIDLVLKFPVEMGFRDTYNYQNRIFGYDLAAKRCLAYQKTGDALFSDHLTRASILWFYAKQEVYIPTSTRPSEFDVWDGARQYKAMHGIYFSDEDKQNELARIFTKVTLLEVYTAKQSGFLPKVFYIYRVGE